LGGKTVYKISFGTARKLLLNLQDQYISFNRLVAFDGSKRLFL